MTRRERLAAIQGQLGACAWCGIKIGPDAHVVARPAGPIAFCPTCLGRYDDPERHPYVRVCLTRQGR